MTSLTLFRFAAVLLQSAVLRSLEILSVATKQSSCRQTSDDFDKFRQVTTRASCESERERERDGRKAIGKDNNDDAGDNVCCRRLRQAENDSFLLLLQLR
ncbi:hypothetical protein ACLKA7_003410 [Drosophila subpalustris]